MQFEIEVSILSDSGKERINVDEKSSFDDICDKIEEKITKWQEYYVLIDNDTRKEITTNKIFDETIEKVQRESRETSVLFLCQAKYTFKVTDETDSKENEFSFPYFPSSVDTFEKFLKKITENCVKWDENCEVVHNAPNNKILTVNDDLSLNKMIETCKNKQKTNIFVCLKMKVCVFSFCFCFCFCFEWQSLVVLIFRFFLKFLTCLVTVASVLCLFCFFFGDAESEKLSGGGRFIKC